MRGTHGRRQMEDGVARLVAAPLFRQRIFHSVVGVERMLWQIHDGQGLRLRIVPKIGVTIVVDRSAIQRWFAERTTTFMH
jgi:hypothetical protein